MTHDDESIPEGKRSVTQLLTWADVVAALYFRSQVCLNLSKRKEDEEMRVLLLREYELYISIAQRLVDEIDVNYRDGL